MDRSARRRARGSGETLAAAPSTRARRRGAGAIVIDLDDHHHRAAPPAPAAAPASRGASSSAGAAAPFVGSVATRTRSRSLAMQAPLVAKEAAPKAKRRRKGTSGEADGGGGGSKGAAATKPESTRNRRGRPRRSTEPARKSKEAEAEADVPACGDWVEVPRVDAASGDDNGESHAVEACDTGQGKRKHRSSAGGSRINEHRGSGVVGVSNSSHVVNDAVSGDAEGVRRRGGEGGRLGVRLDVDEELLEDTVDRQNRGFKLLTAASEDEYDGELLEERLVADLIQAYSNVGNLDANGVDWEAEDAMEFTDDGDDDSSAHDAEEPEPMHGNAKVGMQNLVDPKVLVEPRFHEEEAATENVPDTKKEGGTSFNQALAVAEEAAPRAKRRRKGMSAEADGRGGGSKSVTASKSESTGNRRGRPRRSMEPARKSKEAKSEAEAEAEAEEEADVPACGDWVEVPRVDGASGDDNGKSHYVEACDTGQGKDKHRRSAGGSVEARVFPHFEKKSCASGSRINEHRGSGVVNGSNSSHVVNEVVSGDAEGVRRRGGEGGRLGVRLDVDEEFINEEDAVDRQNRGFVLPTAASEDEYDDEMLEERLVADLVQAYSNVGNLDANRVDWQAEDEMEFTDDGDDDSSAHDAEESEPMHGNAKVGMQNLVDPKVLVEPRFHEEKDATENVPDTKKGGTSFNQGKLHIEILDSDDEVKVLDDASNSFKRKPLPQAKVPVVPCVAWRTRSSWGVVQDRLSYNTYFEELSDEPKEDDDDTEVELDDEEDGDDDGDNSASCDEEEEEEVKEEEEAEKRRLKKEIRSSFHGSRSGSLPFFISRGKRIQKATRKGCSNSKARRQPKTHHRIDSSDDEIVDDTLAHDFKWEVDEHPGIQPLNFDKDGREGPVWNDIPTYLQKQSLTWDLERRKRLKLGTVKNRKLYERHLDSDSNSSGSAENQKHGGDSNIGRKKKHLSSKSGKSGKRSSSSLMLKRQSLLKLLMDKMNGNKDGEFSPFDQHAQFDCNFKDSHPLVFSFGDEDSIPADRPEQNAEVDTLWADFDFALESENIGTYYDDEHQGEINVNLGFGSPTPCSRGKHEFIIDDQIGIRCKYCSLVNLEIRFVLPSMVSNYAEKSSWQNASFLKDALMHHDLCEQVGSVDGQSQDFHLYGTVWDLIPGAISTMYQHQREAIEFMWTNLVGDIRLDELKHGAKPDVVGGCVICHAPGTGKTRLAIVFIQTYMKVFPNCRPVIIAPRGMLFAWEEEFKKWDVNVPFHIMNTTEYSGKEDRDICRLIKKKHRSEKLTRLVKLLSWNKGHGILGISYGLYMKLTSEKAGGTGENKVRSILLENPGLLVLDEGHTPRNERSVMWKTLGKVKTEKRIILSGTPFQNNFLELYNILCLVRPRFGEMFLTKTKLGRRNNVSKKQRDKFSDKYEKGVWASLTSNVHDDNAEKVRSILKPFVHIHNGTILRTLPGLRESVIVLKPPPLQKSIIRKVENIGSGNNFEHEYVISLASTHPSLVTSINMSDEEASLIDKPMLERLRSNPYEGVKTRFVIEIVRLCEALKEKVLIFSQFIQPLELIKEHLRKFFKWRDGKEILQMDGKILPRYRQNSIEVFNDPDSDARVLLASTKACCEGISLTGASRVVLLDVVWNPAVGRQAISRAFRIGQKKFVYTYNLITYGTGEGDKYDRQAEKDHLSKLVFSAEDEFDNVRNMLSKAEMDQCSKLIAQDKVLEEMASHDQLKGMFLKIHYPPTESNMVFTYNQIAPELT